MRPPPAPERAALAEGYASRRSRSSAQCCAQSIRSRRTAASTGTFRVPKIRMPGVLVCSPERVCGTLQTSSRV